MHACALLLTSQMLSGHAATIIRLQHRSMPRGFLALRATDRQQFVWLLHDTLLSFGVGEARISQYDKGRLKLFRCLEFSCSLNSLVFQFSSVFEAAEAVVSPPSLPQRAHPFWVSWGPAARLLAWATSCAARWG